MLENYFCNPRTLFQLRLGPCGQFMDELAEQLQREQYTDWTARSLLKGVSHFSRYAMWLGLKSPVEISIEHINRFLSEHLPVCNCNRPNSYNFSPERSATKKIIVFLQTKGVMKEDIPDISPDSVDGILLRYQKYLQDICGLSSKSIYGHTLCIRRFLQLRLHMHEKLELEKLTAKEVLDLIDPLLDKNWSLDRKSTIVSTTRVFLRFLYWEKIIPKDLGHIVPSVCNWTLKEIPQSISPAQLEQLLKHPDTTTAQGKRDYAILVLLASLGLRASEVTMLRLEQIHWRKRTLTIPAEKSRKERIMPLSDAALNALANYIRNGRPKSEDRQVFLRHKAPIRCFQGTPAITCIVRQHVIKSGIQAPSKCGPHMLRHTLATHLINKSVPLKEIADLLGHSALNTTRIYAKVDLNNLSKTIMPFPNCNWGK